VLSLSEEAVVAVEAVLEQESALARSLDLGRRPYLFPNAFVKTRSQSEMRRKDVNTIFTPP